MKQLTPLGVKLERFGALIARTILAGGPITYAPRPFNFDWLPKPKFFVKTQKVKAKSFEEALAKLGVAPPKPKKEVITYKIMVRDEEGDLHYVSCRYKKRRAYNEAFAVAARTSPRHDVLLLYRTGKKKQYELVTIVKGTAGGFERYAYREKLLTMAPYETQPWIDSRGFDSNKRYKKRWTH